MVAFDSAAALVEKAENENKKISEVVFEKQCEEQEESREEVFSKMKKLLSVMESSSENGCNPNLRSSSGLSGGDAARMKNFCESGKSLLGGLLSNAVTKALAVAESNACMGKIVAAPTAGSSGIVPACVLSLLEEGKASERDAIMSLFTASGFGMIIADKASIAGAQGGCQAECGSAAAMAAAAICEMCGGTPSMCADAAAMAIKSMLGLICDPVAGLVECPCIKRNVSSTMIAFSSAQMALAGIHSKIPCDEVIMTMKRVGDTMPSCFKETATGGLAQSPTALLINKRVFGEKDSRS